MMANISSTPWWQELLPDTMQVTSENILQISYKFSLVREKYQKHPMQDTC